MRSKQAVGNFGTGSRNSRGGALVGFAESNSLEIMSTLFHKWESRKWTWESPNGETKNETDLIQSVSPGIVQDVEVLGKIEISGHRLVRSRIRPDLKIERMKLAKRKEPNLQSLRDGAQEFRITLRNKFAVLTGENENSTDTLDDNLKAIITESAVAVGGGEPRKETAELSQKTKELIAKCNKFLHFII